MVILPAITGADNRHDDLPAFIQGPLVRTDYDGVTDDLLTGGLGQTGLANPPASLPVTPPTVEHLRTLAIHSAYRGLTDTTLGGGYGTLVGPTVTPTGEVMAGQGLIAGTEVLAYARRGPTNGSVMLQIPVTFDPDQPCLLAVATPGSSGLYSGLGGGGEEGLKRGCAVVYTDKGTGTGAHDLHNNTVQRLQGQPVDATVAGRDAQFTARLSESERIAFTTAFPHRYAFKHAHSEVNPEKEWGDDVLRAIVFAFATLNQELSARRLTPANTWVIAAGMSNGGGAALRAAEQDRWGLIDGVVAVEPNIQPTFDPGFVIVQGQRPPVVRHSRSLYETVTLLNVYQGCANRDPALAGAPLNGANPAVLGDNRCQSLRERGLVQSNSGPEQAAEAQALLNAFGLLPEQNEVQPSHWLFTIPAALSVTYANAYARQPVQARLCGYSFAAAHPATGRPEPLATAAADWLFATSSGIPPTGGIALINDEAVGGPTEHRLSVSAQSGRADEHLEGALCLRQLGTPRPHGGEDEPTSDSPGSVRHALRRGVREVRASGRLHGLPALIVTGRSDAVLPPNHTSRAYYGLNQRREGVSSRLRYYEITNAQHFDAFNALPGFDRRFIPLRYYYNQALNTLFAHLTAQAPLPPSQVVRTTPRGVNADGNVPPLEAARHLPALSEVPATDAVITLSGEVLHIPE